VNKERKNTAVSNVVGELFPSVLGHCRLGESKNNQSATVSATYSQRFSSGTSSRQRPTPRGDSPTSAIDRRSLLLFVAAFALVSVLQTYPTSMTFTFSLMRNYLHKS